jgi:hypothetical protein
VIGAGSRDHALQGWRGQPASSAGCPFFCGALARSAPCRTAARAAILILSLLACPLSAAQHAMSRTATPSFRSEPVSQTPAASTRIEDGPVALEVTLSMPKADTVALHYRLRNDGPHALAVFDRGDRHAVLSGRQAPGAIGAPTFEQRDGGDVVLRHVALPAPADPTGPASPRTPLALHLAAGASLEGEFRFVIPTAAPPARVRWCLGVAPFEQERFFAPERAAGVEVWQASDASAQRELCTPWFDCARGTFAER